MRIDATSVASAVAGTAIGIPSLGALLAWVGSPMLFPSTPLESAVFATILLRAVLFFGVPKFRRVRAGTAVILFSADVVLLPVAVALFLLTGDPAFANAGGAYLGAWLSAALLFYTPVAGLAVAIAMRARARLTGTIPTAAGAFVLSALVLDGVRSAAGSQGLVSVARWTIGNLKGQASQSPEVSLLLVGCGALLFVSLATYSVTVGSSERGRLIPQLAVCVTGIGAVLVWAVLATDLPSWSAFGLPAAAIVGVVWVLTREG
jgi:hypothetical protein